MTKVRKEVTIKNPQGLHARPAALFVQITSKFNSDVSIEKAGERVNGKSIMGILTLGAQKDCYVIIEAIGDDDQEVVDALEELLIKENPA